MKARCAQCQNIFNVDPTIQGPQICPHCGASLELNLPTPAASSDAADNSSSDAGQSAWSSSGSDASGSSFGSGSNYGTGGSWDSHEGGVEEIEPTPWEKRGEIGFFKGLFDTIVLSLKTPREFFSKMPSDNARGAVSYFWILGGVSGAFASLWQTLSNMLFPDSQNAARMAKLAEALPALSFLTEPLGGFLCLFFTTILVVPIGLFFSSALIHVFAKMMGSEKPFSATLRAIGYAQAPALFNVIPVIGQMASSVCVVIYGIIALSSLHRMSLGKAAAAYLLPVIVSICLVCGIGLAAFFALGAAAIGRGGMGIP